MSSLFIFSIFLSPAGFEFGWQVSYIKYKSFHSSLHRIIHHTTFFFRLRGGPKFLLLEILLQCPQSNIVNLYPDVCFWHHFRQEKLFVVEGRKNKNRTDIVEPLSTTSYEKQSYHGLILTVISIYSRKL